jgi:hypothetical protein
MNEGEDSLGSLAVLVRGYWADAAVIMIWFRQNESAMAGTHVRISRPRRIGPAR